MGSVVLGEKGAGGEGIGAGAGGFNFDVFAEAAGIDRGVHDFEDVKSKGGGGTRWPLVAKSACQVSEAEAAIVFAVAFDERDFGPLGVFSEEEFHGPAKGIWVGEAESAARAVDFDGRELGCPHIETGDERSTNAACEFQDSLDVGRSFDVDDGAVFRLTRDGAGREGDGSGAANASDGTKERNESGEVVRTHIEHRAATVLVIEFGIGMPRFVAMAHHKGGGGDRGADDAMIEEFSAGLEAGAEEGIGSTAEKAAMAAGEFDKGLSIVEFNAERFFVIDVLSGFEGAAGDVKMRVRCGEV